MSVGTCSWSLEAVPGPAKAHWQMVQGAPAPDLKDYDRECHCYILFDNVSDMQFVLDRQVSVQGNDSIHTLGLVRTGIHEYRMWLHRVPIVAIVNASAQLNSA